MSTTIRRVRDLVSTLAAQLRTGSLASLRPLVRRPALLLGFGCFEGASLVSNRLDLRLKLLAQLRVASLVGCRYCLDLDLGSELGRRAGLSTSQLRDLHRHRSSDHFDPDQRLVLELADALTATPVALDDDLRRRVLDRFGPSELAELHSAIAWENHVARFNLAYDIRPAGFASGACAVPEG